MGAAKKLMTNHNIETSLGALHSEVDLSASNQDVPLATERLPASKVTKVLFVESDIFAARAVCKSLCQDTEAEFKVVNVPGLVEALAELDRGKFDVILLDLSQPETRGLAGFMRMHASYRKIPVVVLTTARDSFIGARAIMAGARGHVIKGQTNSAALIRSIHRALENNDVVRIDLPRASNDVPLFSLAARRPRRMHQRPPHLHLVGA